ncbi:MAG: enoyl-CoA hydratase/isomerase family protein [Candidatus Dormibacteraeota bacterium]|nr:enoyl-CoA hydratase/isomerase family protein [Candidatus Dormibacteraeota bacterium]
MSSHQSGTEQLLVEVTAGVARVTFNNPAKHNALSREMRAALPGVLRGLQEDPEVRVVVVTGAGERAFASGADISELDGRAPPDRGEGGETWSAWEALEKPVLAMIRGYCMGGGLLMALQADIRIAAEGSQFAIPAGRLGAGYPFDGVKALVDVVGPAWASEILFSARRLSSEEALRIGLVNRVVAPERLQDVVAELATSICKNAPLTIRASKAAIREARRDPGQRDLARVAALVEACFRSEDHAEGRRAFQERRPPRFSGR